MKTFADTSFYLLFDEIIRRDRPKDAPDAWVTDGVSWRRSKHSYETQTYGFVTEVYEVTSESGGGWALLVTKEHWWAGKNGETIRSAHWAKLLRGNRATIMAWLRGRQRDVEGTL